MKRLICAIVCSIVSVIVLPTVTSAEGVVPVTSTIIVNTIPGLSNNFIKGADISMLKQIELSGGKYFEADGSQRDCLRILKDHGVNWIRLYWHGTMDNLLANLNDISARFNKEVVVAETASAFTLDNGDALGNLLTAGQVITGGYTATVQGQATAVRDVMEAVTRVPNGKGLGVFYWEPDWIPVAGAGWKNGEGNAWDNQAMFDFSGRVLPSLDVFRMVSMPVPAVAPTVTAIPPLAVTAAIGSTLALPSTASAIYSDGSIRNVAVAWDPIGAPKLAATGAFTVTGTVPGTTVKASAVVTVVLHENLVKNPGFEAGDLLGWTIAGDAVAVARDWNPGNAHTGTTALHWWLDKAFIFTASQTITGLTPCTYVLKAWVAGGGGEKKLQIFADNGVDKKTADVRDTGWKKWVQYVVKDVEISNGTCTVGLSADANGGNWGDLDDVELTMH